MRPLKYYALILFVSIASTSQSSMALEFRGVLGTGFDSGGDLIMSGNFSNGSKWEVKTNEGLFINAGALMQTGSFETQLTAATKFGGATGSNGYVEFQSYPIELIEFYHSDNFRIGVGATYYTSPALKVKLPSGTQNGEYKFQDTVGGVIQIGWAPRSINLFSFWNSRPTTFTIDLRYSAAKFVASNFTTASFTGAKTEYQGNVTGIYLGIYF